ncbi:MAG: hypothetical protein LDL41_21420 [Coleofasciculus sp. S288]|nr:hypothetical protein [Coleofasciculus sp. S288]
MTEPYHGWLIELIPEPTGYLFRCWLPEQRIAISDRKTYPTLAQALRVAKVRADLEAAYLALLHFLNEVYQTCNLSPDEHVALASSVLEFVISSSKKCQ